MNILILEDDKDRHKAFTQRLIGHAVVIVETAKECIQQLTFDKWDVLFLDHDLGGNVYVPSGPGTGYEVACWLEEHEDKIPNAVVLHSLNTPGRERMKQALPTAKEAPFCWDNKVYSDKLFRGLLCE